MTIGRSATTIYIYFRADPARTDEVLQAFSLHQAQLTRPRGALRLARRQEDAPGQVTWMEIHALQPEEDPVELGALVEQSAEGCGLTALATTGRHVETFVQVAA